MAIHKLQTLDNHGLSGTEGEVVLQVCEDAADSTNTEAVWQAVKARLLEFSHLVALSRTRQPDHSAGQDGAGATGQVAEEAAEHHLIELLHNILRGGQDKVNRYLGSRFKHAHLCHTPTCSLMGMFRGSSWNENGTQTEEEEEEEESGGLALRRLSAAPEIFFLRPTEESRDLGCAPGAFLPPWGDR